MRRTWHDARVTTTLPRVRLVKPLERSVRAGHPWIYADAIAVGEGEGAGDGAKTRGRKGGESRAQALPQRIRGPRGGAPATGSAVDVIGADGKFVARGLYDADSPIAIRVATLDPRQSLDGNFIRARVDSALRARRDVIDARTTTAFRWLNGEGDFLPGVVVDVYGSVAILRLDGEAVRAWRDLVVSALVAAGGALGISHVYERSRGGRGEALHGGAPPSPIVIREHDVRFAVDVVRGQKTGFFLDQRENRHAIRPFARGQDVVNLFGYTGGFSVNAALAGARHVITVDVAAAALEDARRNFTINELDPAQHEFAVEDAFAWLERAQQEQRRFGLVITDPPSFAPSQKALQKGLNAYRDLHARALSVVAEGGILAAASCSSHVTMDAFVGTLRDAAVAARRPLRLLELRGQPADHPTLPAFAEGRYLKFVLCRAD
jgi:23S rRNA (cytosine1962-C5)-methyltransferase